MSENKGQFDAIDAEKRDMVWGSAIVPLDSALISFYMLPIIAIPLSVTVFLQSAIVLTLKVPFP